MPVLVFLLLSLVPRLGLTEQASAEVRSHILMVGQSLKLRAMGQIQIEKSTRLKVKKDGSGLRALALKPGAASLQIGSERHEFHILSERQMQTYDFLKNWVPRHPGLNLDLERGEILLTGYAFRSRSWLKIPELCPRCQYRARFQVPAEQQENFRRDLESLLRKRSLPVPSLRFAEELTWSLPSKEKRQSLMKLSETLGLRTLNDEEVVDVAPLVRTQIFVMEVRRDVSRKYGIQWPTSVTAQVLSETPGFSALDFSAQALENEGLAKVLASPSLLCRSGQEAEFFAGGEFPIKILNFRSQGVVWKKYGISLKVKPRADRFGQMSLSLETEISSLDDSRQVDGMPGLFSNRVFSHFDLEESATIAISGLIKNEEGRASQGLPGLMKLPILGALFSSSEFRENRTELVIFVRPEVVDLKAERSSKRPHKSWSL